MVNITTTNEFRKSVDEIVRIAYPGMKALTENLYSLSLIIGKKVQKSIHLAATLTVAQRLSHLREYVEVTIKKNKTTIKILLAAYALERAAFYLFQMVKGAQISLSSDPPGTKIWQRNHLRNEFLSSKYYDVFFFIKNFSLMILMAKIFRVFNVMKFFFLPFLAFGYTYHVRQSANAEIEKMRKAFTKKIAIQFSMTDPKLIEVLFPSKKKTMFDRFVQIIKFETTEMSRSIFRERDIGLGLRTDKYQVISNGFFFYWNRNRPPFHPGLMFLSRILFTPIVYPPLLALRYIRLMELIWAGISLDAFMERPIENYRLQWKFPKVDTVLLDWHSLWYNTIQDVYVILSSMIYKEFRNPVRSINPDDDPDTPKTRVPPDGGDDGPKPPAFGGDDSPSDPESSDSDSDHDPPPTAPPPIDPDGFEDTKRSRVHLVPATVRHEYDPDRDYFAIEKKRRIKKKEEEEERKKIPVPPPMPLELVNVKKNMVKRDIEGEMLGARPCLLVFIPHQYRAKAFNNVIEFIYSEENLPFETFVPEVAIRVASRKQLEVFFKVKHFYGERTFKIIHLGESVKIYETVQQITDDDRALNRGLRQRTRLGLGSDPEPRQGGFSPFSLKGGGGISKETTEERTQFYRKAPSVDRIFETQSIKETLELSSKVINVFDNERSYFPSSIPIDKNLKGTFGGIEWIGKHPQPYKLPFVPCATVYPVIDYVGTCYPKLAQELKEKTVTTANRFREVKEVLKFRAGNKIDLPSREINKRFGLSMIDFLISAIMQTYEVREKTVTVRHPSTLTWEEQNQRGEKKFAGLGIYNEFSVKQDPIQVGKKNCFEFSKKKLLDYFQMYLTMGRFREDHYWQSIPVPKKGNKKKNRNEEKCRLAVCPDYDFNLLTYCLLEDLVSLFYLNGVSTDFCPFYGTYTKLAQDMDGYYCEGSDKVDFGASISNFHFAVMRELFLSIIIPPSWLSTSELENWIDTVLIEIQFSKIALSAGSGGDIVSKTSGLPDGVIYTSCFDNWANLITEAYCFFRRCENMTDEQFSHLLLRNDAANILDLWSHTKFRIQADNMIVGYKAPLHQDFGWQIYSQMNAYSDIGMNVKLDESFPQRLGVEHIKWMGFFPKKLAFKESIHYVALREAAEGLKALAFWTDTDPQRIKKDIGEWPLSMKEKMKMCLISTLLTDGWNVETNQICRQINTMYLSDINVVNIEKVLKMLSDKYPDANFLGLDKITFDQEGLPTPASITNLWCVQRGTPWFLQAVPAFKFQTLTMSISSIHLMIPALILHVLQQSGRIGYPDPTGTRFTMDDVRLCAQILDQTMLTPYFEELIKRLPNGWIFPIFEYLYYGLSYRSSVPYIWKIRLVPLAMHYLYAILPFWMGCTFHGLWNLTCLMGEPRFFLHMKDLWRRLRHQKPP